MSVLSLGYLHLRTPNLDAWRTFATEVLGLMLTSGPEEDSQYYRWDAYPYRLVLSPAQEASVSAIGFEVGDDRDLHALVQGLESAGVAVKPGSDEEAAGRLVSGFASFEDPAGAPIEIFNGPILSHELLHTPLVSGFVTGEMGLGHVVIKVPDLNESIDFYRDHLGFHMRNTWYFAGMSMAFLGCNPRHHSLAFGCGMPAPGLLTHFMVEMATIDDVGRAQDRCVDHGVPVVMGLGRHTNDHMISFYCQTPDGFMVEVGWGGLRIDDATTTTTYQITKPSFWGHRPIITK
ncbi:MAG TPA: VOC family protein [Acidimicrobiales bacterium]|nr:VOC family protein [Acidimicrobiales bacterium]